MICTLASLILAAILILTGQSEAVIPNTSLVFSIGGAVFLFAIIASNIGLIPALQRAEKSISPRIVELFKRDSIHHLISIEGALLTLISFFFAFTLAFNSTWLFAAWIVLAGITLDLQLYDLKRVLGYLNPFSIIQMFKKQATASIREEKDEELCEWLDALSEIGIKGISVHSIGLCNSAIDEMQQITQVFMESCKSIGHLHPPPKDEKVAAEDLLGTDADQVNYILFYLYQRLEFLYDKALTNKLEPVCSSIISSLGKISIRSAKFDLTLASYPVHFIGKLANKAQENQMPEIGVKATLTLFEIAKTIINEVPFTASSDLKDPFLSIITYMDTISKTAFQKDKSISVPLLTQPFKDLKTLLADPKVASHQDTSVILANIDRVLADYEALEMVLKTLPSLSEITGVAPPSADQEL